MKRDLMTEEYVDPETGEKEKAIPMWPAWSRRMLTTEERRERYRIIAGLSGDSSLARQCRDYRRPVFRRHLERLAKEQGLTW